MLFENNDRQALRQFYFDVWQKYQTKQPLEPMEQQVIQLILQHPEYQALFNAPDKHLIEDYAGAVNPFLHLSLHQALLEQISTNRPAGITYVYQKLIGQCHDVHTAEHQMMEVLAEALWESMQQGKFIDEADYLARLQNLQR